MAYQEKIGNAVTKGGFFKHSDYVGGSPDGLVGPQGGIEIKCLSSANHLGLLRCKSQEALKANYLDHYAQCQFNMYLSDSIWWDFIAFDPRYIDAKKRLHVIGMVLDTDFVAELLDRSGIAIRLMAKLAEDFYK